MGHVSMWTNRVDLIIAETLPIFLTEPKHARFVLSLLSSISTNFSSLHHQGTNIVWIILALHTRILKLFDGIQKLIPIPESLIRFNLRALIPLIERRDEH